MTILVTGGAGFIGSNFILDWFEHSNEPVINVDKLTYAGNQRNLDAVAELATYRFVNGSISDRELIGELLSRHEVRAVVNFAAESHVDRSISGPDVFFETNVMGTLALVEATLAHYSRLGPEQKHFRFLHVSTDEVFGTLGPSDPAFAETHPYLPNSPYAASKASSDHVVRSYRETFGLPAIITNCSNNYGPYQFPEKLVPLIIHNALGGKALPIYGDGRQIRDWLYVGDHCSAIRRVLQAGRPGETYNIGGGSEETNLEVVRTLCVILDELRPRADRHSYLEQVTFVKDRPGHDRRYAIDSTKIGAELGWAPRESFRTGMYRTVEWYLANSAWMAEVTSGAYRGWVAKQYA